MSDKIKVSVIVPCYNVEEWVGQCLDSLVRQTMPDIEIICIDDKSTDNTLNRLKQYADTDKRIKIVCNTQNCGLSETRNHGMKCAKAPYIMFCDSDDWFADDMCEKMYDAVTTENADIAICGTEVIYEADYDRKSADDKYFAISHSGTLPLTPDIQNTYSVCAPNKIYKREIIQKYDVWFPRGLKYEDNYFYHVYCLWVDSVAFVADKLYKYRRRAGSIMNDTYGKKALNLNPLHIAIAWFEYAKAHDKLDGRESWFWGYFFYMMFRETLSYSGKNNHKYCYDAAHRFMKQHLNVQYLDNKSQCKVEQIRLRAAKPRRLLGGMIKLQGAADEIFLRAFGIKLFRIKYDTQSVKYYLFGLRVW